MQNRQNRRTELLKPELKVRFSLEPVGTGTECIIKIRTGTEEFWNRPSTNAQTTSKTYDNPKRYHQRECDFTHSGRDRRSKSKVISNYEQKGVLVPINV